MILISKRKMTGERCIQTLMLDKVFNAKTVLKSIIRQTDVVHVCGIVSECELFLKPDNLQITGSFKVNGSAYKMSSLTCLLNALLFKRGGSSARLARQITDRLL